MSPETSPSGWPTEAEREKLLTAEELASSIISSEGVSPAPSSSDTSAERLPALDVGAEAPATAVDDDADTDAGEQVMSLLKPVTLTMVLVVLLTNEMSRASVKVQAGFSEMLVYEESDSDSVGTILEGVLLNSVVVVFALFVVTTGLLLLYKWRCYLIIYTWLFVSVSTMLGFFGGFVAQELLAIHDVPVDRPAFTLIMYNFAAVGTLLVFWQEYGCGPSPPLEFQQAYLILISALFAWTATEMPEWSTWGLLGAVAVWDIVAVLTPRGPLKMLVQEAEARGEPIPGLVYTGANIRLGLGDFIFYSVLVGRASMRGSATLLACTVAVLAGLCATLALLPVLQRVLPALPISIAVGIAFYFTSVNMLAPMASVAACQGLFL